LFIPKPFVGLLGISLTIPEFKWCAGKGVTSRLDLCGGARRKLAGELGRPPSTAYASAKRAPRGDTCVQYDEPERRGPTKLGRRTWVGRR
jgi:hypothetical protein